MKRLFALVIAFIFAVSALFPALPQKAVAAGPNLIDNPSLETANGANPANWFTNKWGTNTATFTYNTTGRTGGRSVTVNTTAYTNGDAKWYPAVVAVSPNTAYTFSDWYMSNVTSEITAQFTSTSNAVTYKWLGTLAASTAWKQAQFSFTTPANIKNVTFFHYTAKKGSLTTDDYSLVSNAVNPTPPTVQLTAPATGATVSGTQTVSANASDAAGVSKVQFMLNGTNLGTADTTAPYSVSWDTKTVANGTHTLTAVATNTNGLSTTSASAQVTVANTTAPTPPIVSISAPAANATVSGTQAINANASDAQAVTSVQFKLDGTNLGAADTTAPYSINWDTKTATNGAHSLTAVATNANGLTTTSSAVTVNVSNIVPTPPTVNITAPTASAVVAGTQSVTANASDTIGVANVQFKLNGVNLGTADTTAPYSVSWDTKTVANGTHSLTAVATNTNGMTTTSSAVVVTVNNVVTPPNPVANLIPNGSFETSSNGTSPDNWLAIKWGTNTATLSYQNTGKTGSRSVRADVTSYTNGAANWYYNGVNVTPGKQYQFSNWYQSNVDTEIDAEVTLADGTVQYLYLAYVPANTAWTKMTATFTAPANAKSVTVYQLLAKKGYLVVDDYSLTEYTPAQFSRGLVSLTFDDAWRSIYTNGLPIMDKYGFVSTQYMLTGTTTYPDYMTIAMMQEYLAKGHEIASHTIDHPNLTTLNGTELTRQLSQSQTSLRSWMGNGVAKNFASPYGAYNTTTVNEIMKYYRSHRSTDEGFNSKDNFDIRNIRVQNILDTTTQAEFQSWVDQAIATKTWLVLVYHEVEPSAADPTYAVTPANLDAQLGYIKQTGVTVKTLDQALDEILPQL